MMNQPRIFGAALAAAVLLSAALAVPAGASHQHKKTAKKAHAAAKPVKYADVAPIFNRCVMCHHGPKAPAKMHLDSYEGIMKGNDDGPVIKPGNPQASLLSKMVHGSGKKRMPPPPMPPLTKEQIAKIDAWIKAGAKK